MSVRVSEPFLEPRDKKCPWHVAVRHSRGVVYLRYETEEQASLGRAAYCHAYGIDPNADGRVLIVRVYDAHGEGDDIRIAEALHDFKIGMQWEES